VKNKFKAFYFILFLSFGIIGPYRALYLSQKGFSGTQIGLLIGIVPILSIVFQPIWGALSDLLHTRRMILIIGCLGVSLSMVGVGLGTSFTVNFLYFTLFSIFITPIGPIATAFVLDYLDEIEKPDGLSMIRLWGSIGFSVSSLVLGSILMDQRLELFPWLLVGVYILLGAVSLTIPESKTDISQSDIKLRELFQLSKNTSFMIFLAGMVFIGATLLIANNFQTTFLLSINASSLLIGVIVSLPALLEIPMLIITPALLKKFRLRQLIIAGAVLMPIRWGLFYMIQNPGWMIPAQLLNGVATISIDIAGVSYIDKSIPSKWRATGQGLYTTAAFAIGPGIGNFVAGNILDKFNVRAIWVFNLALGVVGLVLVFIALWFLSRPIEKDPVPSENMAN
jgi:PPP family 3-phenylpropionic acid transporter